MSQETPTKPNRSGWQLYAPGTEGDGPLLAWYLELCQDGSLELAFAPSLFPVGSFMREMISENTALLFAEDEKGWWGVSWFTPVLGGASWGLWIRSDKRGPGNDDKMHFVMETLDAGLTGFPLVIAPTKQDKVRDLAIRLGFTFMGQIPYLFEGSACYILYITREAFAPVFEEWSSRQWDS